MMFHHVLRLSFAVACLSLLVLAPATSGEPAPGALPGVDASAGEKVVGVRPLPKISDARQTPEGDGWVRVGDWDVKISGSVQIDIGVGKALSERNGGGR